MIEKFAKDYLPLIQFFPEFKEENNFYNSEDYYNCENKYSEETRALTCSIIVRVFLCLIHHATNPMKQGFRIVLQLHFEADQFCDVENANGMRLHEAPIKIDENDGLF